MKFSDLCQQVVEATSTRFKAPKGSGSLPESLLSHMIGPILEGHNWKLENRESGLHCSQMSDFCPRRGVLSTLFPIDDAQNVDPLTRLRFDTGRALHSLFQNYYLGPSGILVGAWKCSRCGRIVGDYAAGKLVPMPVNTCGCGMRPKRLKSWKAAVSPTDPKASWCKACIWPSKWPLDRHCQLCYLGNGWVYQEPMVKDAVWGLVGHCDGVLRLSGGDMLLELKTIGPKGYPKLTKPFAAHEVQAQLYMHYMGIHQMLFVYIDKANTTPDFLKEYVLAYDPSVVEEVLAKVRLYWRSLAEDSLPPRNPFCERVRGRRACAWRSYCFDPATLATIQDEFAKVVLSDAVVEALEEESDVEGS